MVSNSSTHGHGHKSRVSDKSRYGLVTSINAVLFVAVTTVGLISSSKALVANGLHLLLDVGSLLISAVATTLSGRAPNEKNSFGLIRLEVVAALITSVSLLLASVYLVVDALVASGATSTRSSGEMAAYLTLFGVVGIVVNFISILLLAGAKGDALLRRANILHFGSDSIAWLAALIAGILAHYIAVTIADLGATIVVAVVIVISTISVIREIVAILLDSVPSRLSLSAIEAEIKKVDRVVDVHHLHVWSLSSSESMLSGHVICDSDVTIHEGQSIVTTIKQMLESKFSINHATIEMECHVCDVPIHEVSSLQLHDHGHIH